MFIYLAWIIIKMDRVAHHKICIDKFIKQEELFSRLGILRDIRKSFLALATNIACGLGFRVQFLCRLLCATFCSSGPSESSVALAGDGSLYAAGADVDSSLVCTLPIAGDGRLFWQRQVGLAFFNGLGLVCMLVDDGLIRRVSSRVAKLIGLWVRRFDVTFIAEILEFAGVFPPRA